MIDAERKNSVYNRLLENKIPLIISKKALLNGLTLCVYLKM